LKIHQKVEFQIIKSNSETIFWISHCLSSGDIGELSLPNDLFRALRKRFRGLTSLFEEVNKFSDKEMRKYFFAMAAL